MTRLLVVFLLTAAPVAAQTPPITLIVRNHVFSPARIDVPTGQKIELRITNADATEEEFDSSDLHREKDLPPGREVVVFVGPLRAGTYEFIGELHPDTAHGQVVAK